MGERRVGPGDTILDPVVAYDRIAVEYQRISEARQAYLGRVEELVVTEIPAAARSLLDVGAGDGLRAQRIASAAGIAEVVLLEPSEGMRKFWPCGTEGWPIRAQDLGEKSGRFDAITCLWNVLGHIGPASARVNVLRDCARLLSPAGFLFIDVSHRFNAVHYGVVATAVRFVQDTFRPNEKNGDVIATWAAGGGLHSTSGHVFTDGEFRRLALFAGLSVRKALAIDYSTGEISRSKFGGHLFYMLQRSS